jgi:hypothetical protein
LPSQQGIENTISKKEQESAQPFWEPYAFVPLMGLGTLQNQRSRATPVIACETGGRHATARRSDDGSTVDTQVIEQMGS